MRRWLIALTMIASLTVIVLVWTRLSDVGPQSSPGEAGVSRDSSHEPENAAAADETREPVISQEMTGPSVSGAVKYQDTGKPVSSIEVAIWNSNAGSVSTHTDAEGSFVLEGLAPNVSYVLDAITEEPGLITVRQEFLNLGLGESRTGVTLLVCRVGSISGKVVRRQIAYHPERARRDDCSSFQDAPLEGVKVVLRIEKDQWFEKEAITDPSGCFIFEGLRPAAYIVRADLPHERVAAVSEEHPDRSKTISLNAGENRRDIELFFRADCVSIAGRVSAASGVPIQGAKVSATVSHRTLVPSDDLDPLDGTKSETATDEDGRYQLDGLYPADMRSTIHYLSGGGLTMDYEVRASADGYAAALVKIPAFTRENVKDAIAFMDLGDEEGEVVEVREAPLAASLGGVLNVDVILQPEAMVSGQLVDTQKQPIGKARLRMVSAETSTDAPPLLITRPQAPDWTETDERGQFTFRNLPTGSYLFEVSREFEPSQHALNPPLKVDSGASLSNVSVVVEAMADLGALQGRVVDSISRKAIKSFSVKVLPLAGADNRGPSKGDVTQDGQEEGSFLVSEVSPGVLTLEISASEYGSEVFDVEIPQGKAIAHDFLLKPEGIMSGRIYQNGVGAPVYYVLLSSINDGVGGTEEARTDEDGNYIFRQVPSGKYVLRVSSMESVSDFGTTLQVNQRTEVEVRAGMQTSRDFYFEDRASVSGRFSCSERGLRGQVVVLDGELADWNGEASKDERVRALTWDTAKAGAYKILGLEPGTYTVIGICYKEENSGRRIVDKQLSVVSLAEGEEEKIDYDF